MTHKRRELKIQDVMTREMEIIDPDATVQEAAARMRHWDIGALPVCHGSHTFGIVTDRDLVIRAVAEGADPKAVLVRDVMSQELVACSPDSDITEAIRVMKEKRIRRLLVVDRHKRPVGIVSLSDIARHEPEEIAEEHVIDQISRPV